MPLYLSIPRSFGEEFASGIVLMFMGYHVSVLCCNVKYAVWRGLLLTITVTGNHVNFAKVRPVYVLLHAGILPRIPRKLQIPKWVNDA